MDRSNAAYAQALISYKNLEEKTSNTNVLVMNTNAQLQGYRQQSAKDKSELEAKIKMTNEELAKMSQERYDSLAAWQQRVLDFENRHTPFKQSTYYPDDKKNAIETKTIDVYDHQIVTDKLEYLKLSTDDLDKRRQEYIAKNETVVVARPAPPPPPPPQEHEHHPRFGMDKN